MNARKLLITAMTLSIVTGQMSNVFADDFVPAVDSVPNNTATTYTLDSGNSGGDITLQFGGTLAQTLKWNSATSRFNLSAPLDITGDVTTSTGSTMSGGIINLNNNSNFAVNIGTGTSTGTVTIGGAGAQTLDIGNGAGAKTVGLGSSNTTSTTTILSGSGGVLINDTNNQPTTINGGTSTGAVSIASGSGTQTVSVGGGSTGVKTVNVGSTNTTSATNISSGSGGVNVNASNNQPTNINTGTSTGAVAIGGNANTVAVDSSSWDITSAGIALGFTGITSTGSINFIGATAFRIPQGAANPATCAVGQEFYNTTTGTVVTCTTTNTWTSSTTGTNYTSAYNTTTQTVATARTFQAITFSNNGLINGWTHTPGTANFTCADTGQYLVTYSYVAETTGGGGGGTTFEIRGVFNGAEVAGSQAGNDIGNNNVLYRGGNSFILNATAAQVLALQMTSSVNTARIAPGGTTATTRPSITISIVRIN